jgi:spermidine/putrescine transport system ATP-binding protein
MTILENVAFGLRRRKIADADKLAKEALDLVELAHVASRKPSQLSGGQQQRVALARAVVNRPALLLLDEPLGALDLKLRRQMQLELKDIQSEVGLTFLHVTHDQEEAMTMADTVAVMNQGRIEQMGAPETLYELPTTAFVATFLGQSNLFTGDVTGSSASTMTVGIAGVGVVVPLDRAQVHRGVVTVGVRPEKVTLHRQKPSGSDRTIIGPGRVIDASFSGVSTQYTVAVPGFGDVTVFAQNTSIGDNAKPGDEVFLSWSPEHAFGLLDHPSVSSGKFVADTDTGSLVVAEREKLEAELEES